MKFTIFTSFYNYLDNVEELYNSIVSQTYKNWEWVISDDFSENPEVIKKLKEIEGRSNKIKIILPKFKKEFYWNPPTSQSDSDIFLVQDSDDIMHPKLLEVYKHHFEKFPHVQLLSVNSIMKWNNVYGDFYAVRDINYGENCNFTTMAKYDPVEDKIGNYSIGDCRAWRNNIELFDPERKWKHCAEDVSKVLKCEEKGKILYLPRVLHTYSHREDSLSKQVIEDFDTWNEPNIMFENAEKRLSRKELNSIEDYYDRIYDITTPFYVSSFNNSNESYIIEFISSKLTPRSLEILRDLYFDHTIVIDISSDVDFLVIQINDEDEINLLEERIVQKLPNKEIIVECDIEIMDKILYVLESAGLQYSWTSYDKCRINVPLC